jgi:hypothetical protein
VGQEEMGGGSQKQTTFAKGATKTDSNPATLLEKVMDSKNVTFDMIKGRLVEEEFKGASSFLSIKDIPKTKTFELIARLKKL